MKISFKDQLFSIDVVLPSGKMTLLLFFVISVIATPIYASNLCKEMFYNSDSISSRHFFENLSPAFFEKDENFGGTSIALGKIPPDNSSSSQKPEPLSNTPVPMIQYKILVSEPNKGRLVSWSRVVQPKLYGNKKILAGEFLESHKHQVKGVNLLWPYATINFVTSGLSPERSYALHFRTPETQKLSVELGKDVWLENVFQAEGHRKFDWTTLYLNEFRCVTDTGEVIADLKIEPTTEVLQVGISVASADGKSKTKVEPIKIADHLLFSVALKDSSDISEMLKFNYRFARANGLLHSLRRGVYNTEMGHTVVVKFIESMKKKENQIYARDIIRQGFDSVQKAMAKLGYGIKEYRINRSDPHRDLEYRSAGLDREIKLLEFITDILAQGVIPRELGLFGDLHGTWVHHAQILAGLKDLNQSERVHFMAFMMDYMSGDPLVWTMWNLLFDSHGPGVHGVKFWRDLIDSRETVN